MTSKPHGSSPGAHDRSTGAIVPGSGGMHSAPGAHHASAAGHHAAHGHGHGAAGGHGHGHGGLPRYAHPAPAPLLYAVFFILVGLTVLTVVANTWPLGRLDIIVALTIATIKATLVVLFFMHMWWEKGFYAIVFLSSLAFFALFVGFTLVDSQQYSPDIESFPASQRPSKPYEPPPPNLPVR